MRHRNSSSIAVYLLAALMFICNSLSCRAAQIGSGAYPNEDAAGNIGEGAWVNGEIGSAEKNYILTTDRSLISLGTVEQNSIVALQDILLTNAGEEDIRFFWQKADYHDCITVDAPDHAYMRPGESCVFAVAANSSLEPGTYSAALMFADEGDPGFERGVQVDILLEIRKPEPPSSAVTSVSISPGTAVVAPNSSCAFTASVAGKNDYSREVVWSVSGQTSRNTMIDAKGILHTGADESSSSLTVKAVSKQDARYSASALVSLHASSYFIQVGASPANGGIVHGNSSVREGGRAVISAAPNNGFVFDCWLLNGSRVSQNSQYTIDNIHSGGTYVASFKPVSCLISASVNNSNGGTVTGGGIAGYGGNMTLTATAKDGYRFDGWMENDAVIDKNNKMELKNITSSRYFTAVFSQNRYSLSLVCLPTNAGNATGQGVYAAGSNAGIKAAPGAGYRFVGWAENGKIINTDREYSVKNILRDMCLTAVFEKEQEKTYSITTESSAGATITPDEKNIVSEEAEIPAEEIGSADSAEEIGSADSLEHALKTGALQVTIHNDFTDIAQETHYSSFNENSGALNFEMVLEHLLSDEDRMELAQGNSQILINLHIDDVVDEEAQTMTDVFERYKLRGMEIGRCFNMFLLESKQGDTSMISELPEELRVVINIPEHLKADNREFFIMRLHMAEDGSADYAELADQDEDPDTITFFTDKFSPYAIAYMELSQENTNEPDVAQNTEMSEAKKDIIAVVCVAAACIVTFSLSAYMIKRRRR